MDLHFFRRVSGRLDGVSPARLDYGILKAALSVAQTSCPAARPTFAQSSSGLEWHPLVELLTAGPRWRDAVRAQGGSFHRGITGPAGNGS